MNWLLLHLPTAVLGLLTVGAVVALSAGGLFLVRRNVELQTLESHNAVAGFIIAVVGVVYAVLLGFVVVVVWQEYADARAAADDEATLVASLFENAAAFSEPQRGELDQRLETYARSVITEEWAAMARQRERVSTELAFHDLWQGFRTATPHSRVEQIFYDQSIQQMEQLTEARQDRLLASHAKVPGVMWTVLLMGGLITVGFTYFFGVSNFRAQLMMVLVLATTVGLVLFLILAMNYPFTGGLSIRPSAMQEVLEDLRFIAM